MKKDVEFHLLKDEELVSHIIATKNVLIFNVLYKRYEKKIYNKILGFGIPKEAVEDLMTYYFLNLYTDLKRFDGETTFAHWMYYRLYQYCTSFVNSDEKSLRAIKKVDIEKSNLRIKVNDSILYQMNPLKLKKIMRCIEPTEKSILLLHYQDDVSIKQLQLLYNADEEDLREKLRKAKARIVEIYNDL